MKSASAWHKPDQRSENSVANEVRSIPGTFVCALYYDPHRMSPGCNWCAWNGDLVVTGMDGGECETVEEARAKCDAQMRLWGWRLE